MKFLLLIPLLFLSVSVADPIVPQSNPKLEKEIRCMAANLYFEARGEGERGMIAVGHVTLNRVRSKDFPSTICGVVKQRSQFSWYKPGMNLNTIDIPAHIHEIAFNLVTGQRKYIDKTKGSLYFHREDVRPFRTKFKIKIGKHLFYA